MDPGTGAPEPFRAYMASIPGWVEVVMYAAFVAVVLVLARDATLRLRRYGIGWRTFLGALLEVARERRGPALRLLARDVLGQGRVRRDRQAARIHGLVFGSFAVLTVGTFLIALEEDLTAPLLGLHFLRGPAYLAYEVILDTAGLLLIAGVLLGMWRRYRNPPAHLGDRPTMPLVYGLLLLAAVSGFVLEALRLLAHPVPWGGASYVGSALGSVIGPIVGERALEAYWVAWTGHFVGAFVGMGLVLRTAFDHVLVLPANLALQAGRDPARLSLPFNLATIDEAGLETLSAGFGDVRQLDWRRRFSLDACVQCGRCDRACPALAAGRPLSPRSLVGVLGSEIRAAGGEGPSPAGNGIDLFSRGVLAEATAWSCLACGACAAECPAWIDQPGTIIDLRRHLVGEGRLNEQQAALASNVERNGNPFGLPSYDRATWLDAMGVPSIRDVPDAEYLYWIGCMASYDPVARSVAVSMIRILRHAGVSFAVLGAEERCTGESLRKMGDEAGFQVRAMENVALLQEVGARRILTHCPHCLVTLSRDYPAFGGTFEVVHHTRLLRDLVAAGRIPAPAPGAGASLAYHDPCNLGRLGGELEAPREVARFAAGGEIREAERSGDRSFCCGAGGGGSWWTVPAQASVSQLRLGQLRETGADTVATACPYCLTMLRDAAVTTEADVRVADLAELVAALLPAEEDAGVTGDADGQALPGEDRTAVAAGEPAGA